MNYFDGIGGHAVTLPKPLAISIMATKKLKPAHPGKILREEIMEPVGITAYALAKALHVPISKVNEVVREKRAISPELAVLLSAYFGTSQEYWIKLQTHYDLRTAEHRLSRQVARIQPHPHEATGALRSVIRDRGKPILAPVLDLESGHKGRSIQRRFQACPDEKSSRPSRR